MLRCMLGSVAVSLLWAGAASAASLPAPDFGAGAWGSQFTIAPDGARWAFDGNTVYRHNTGTDAFEARQSASASGSGLGFDAGPLCFTADGGQMLILSGDGGLAGGGKGLALYDVAANTISDLTALAGLTNYAAARNPLSGDLYVLAVKPTVSTNMLYQLDLTVPGGSASERFALDGGLAGDYASGGIAFDAAGNLYAAPFGITGPVGALGEVPILTIAADQLDLAAPTIETLTTLSLNGSGSLAVQGDGQVLLATWSGVHVYDPAAGVGMDVLGDTGFTGWPPAVQVQGALAVDPVSGMALVATDAGGIDTAIPVPEPASLAGIGLGGFVLAVRRRRRAA